MKFELKPVMPETYHIRLEGKVHEWTTSTKHVGNYIRNDLSEYDELRHKQGDFIGRFNGLSARYHDATHEVLKQLTSSYCTHLYGSQAWQFNDTNVHRMFTTWNKAIKRIWNLPTHSHRVLLLCGLNEGNHVYDYVFKRSIISKNLQFICETSNTKESEVINGYRSHVCKREDILRYKQTIAMIIELNLGIPGFDNDAIKDILYYISTI